MKRRHFTFVILTVLFIAPMIFSTNSYGVAILTQPNPTKDFQTSAYLDESEYSITSFSETLPDDEIFYPDAIENDTILLAESGQGTWFDADHVDAAYWYGTYGDGYVLAQWNTTPRNSYYIESFDYAFYGHSVLSACEFVIRTSASHTTLETVATGANAWYNGSFVPDANDFYQINDVLLNLGLLASAGAGAELLCDYVEISSITYMTYSGPNHHAESFANISDWVLSTGLAPSSDGDIMTWETETGDYDFIYSNSISLDIAGYYIEFRIKTNRSGTCHGAITLYSSDDMGGSAIYSTSELYPTGDFTTYKYYVSGTGTAESIRIRFKDASADAYIQLDYLRIGPSDEMGFQHDGSTTEGITPNGAVVASSDGDLLDLSIPASYDYFRFYIDTTATKTRYDADYYPFIHIAFSSGSIGGKFALYATDTTNHLLQNDLIISQTDYYYNVKSAVTSDVQYFYMYVFAGFDYSVDFIKAYSIANFTVTQSASVTTSEYMFVENGVLKLEKSSSNYLKIDNDITLSIDRDTYDSCNLTLSNYVLTAPTDFIFWEGATTHTDETSFSFSGSGTLTDFQITFYSNNDFYLSEIKFIDTRDWQEIDTITVFIVVLYDYFAFNMLLILLGFVIVIFSACFLAYSIRTQNVTRDKTMYLLFFFMLGWGLVLGGALLG